jgi:hypothetical protein
MNRDAAVNMARVLNKFALENGCKRNFVMLGSAKSLPWTQEYLTTKIEAEDIIQNEFTSLKPTLIRPGMVIEATHRNWSVAVKPIVNILFNINEQVV